MADQFKNLNAGAVDISYDGGTDFGGGGSSDDSDSGMAMMAPGGGSGGGFGGGFGGAPSGDMGRRFLIGRRGAGRITGERCLPVTAAVCRIWEAFSADRAIWKTA